MREVQHDIARGLSQEETGRLLALGSKLTLPSGASLFRLGDPAESLFVIERGRINLTLPMNVRGHEENVLVEERMSGQTVGWSALIPPYRFTLAASAPLETIVIALPREALRSHFADCSRVGQIVALNVASGVGQRLQLMQTMWLREMQRTVESRCA